MSVKHPVIAVTGSSGAGTSTVKHAFDDIFRREKVEAAVIEGDSFHRYDRNEMKVAIAEAAKKGTTISHFGPEGNHFDKLEELFRTYGETGTGKNVITCITKKKLNLTIKRLEPLLPGKILIQKKIYFFMKVCTAVRLMVM